MLRWGLTAAVGFGSVDEVTLHPHSLVLVSPRSHTAQPHSPAALTESEQEPSPAPSASASCLESEGTKQSDLQSPPVKVPAGSTLGWPWTVVMVVVVVVGSLTLPRSGGLEAERTMIAECAGEGK